ncbi:glycerol-3-phosphate 1-O-acyltransferase PlsY [Paenibacillus thalictri]|uniref:Glycerol-3-phosphate acyltransferase n=1 Tax=Paenibacillus thalictri TaxID=2527873 RepID=A0A4Q9DTV0_9BACL|nr:glycerol-3-phosphate 1-O-acyltransferase PlsY [Paenibacillus thalictri]TBL79766.1 glycerol-3-phosphate 1-O-acyltransferase [Paenibacillus thalictri]
MTLNIVSIIVGYLLGSISFSYLAGRLLKGIDIRNHGSGNAGATNTLRVLGKGPAVVVLLLDAVKGAAAVGIGYAISGGDPLIQVLCGLAAIAGHNWPVYFGFRGGKGIATTIGAMASLAFVPTLIAGIIAIVVIALTKYVSLGSLLLTAVLPFLLYFTGKPMEMFWFSILLALFAFVRHRSNIVRLVQGNENKLGTKKA